jgi:hypothetical protein
MPAAGGGMFGMTPQEVYQQQQQGINQSAKNLAEMDGFTAAKYMMGKVGGGLAAPVAGMLGLKNTEMENAQQEQDIQSQIDHSTPDGLMKGAQLFNQAGNPRMAMMYQQAAQAMIAQNAELEKDQAQTAAFNAKANAPAKVTAPPTRSYENNGQKITEELQPDGTWKTLGRSSAYKPNSGGSADKAPTMRTIYDGGEAVQQEYRNGQWVEVGRGSRSTADGTRGIAAQQFKQKQQMGKDKIALRSMDAELTNLKDAATKLKDHKGLNAITGAGYLTPDMPKSDAAEARSLLEEFKAATKKAGLQLVTAFPTDLPIFLRDLPNPITQALPFRGELQDVPHPVGELRRL